MSVCKSCGQKFSKWTTPVSAHGVCRECFEAELAGKRNPERAALVARAEIEPVPVAEPQADSLGEKASLQPRTPIELFVETLGVTLALFGARLVLAWLEPGSAVPVTTHGLIASSLTYLGWILVVVCLLNRTGRFKWRLPNSTRGWREEFIWAVLLLLMGVWIRVIAVTVGRYMHLRGATTVWHEALRNHNTWITYLIVVPVSAIYQELVYRAYMQSRLTQILRGQSVLVVLICSGIFAAMHGYAPLQSLGIFATGVLLGTSYQLNGKIPRLIIAHTANNMIASFG